MGGECNTLATYLGIIWQQLQGMNELTSPHEFKTGGTCTRGEDTQMRRTNSNDTTCEEIAMYRAGRLAIHCWRSWWRAILLHCIAVNVLHTFYNVFGSPQMYCKRCECIASKPNLLQAPICIATPSHALRPMQMHRRPEGSYAPRESQAIPNAFIS